jgi:hypothetical protein
MRSLMGNARHANTLDGLVAIALGSLFFALYLLTLCRVVFWYDSAEYVTAAVTLGIPHPPGYPLYTVVGHLFTWLPLESAVALNAMSATFAAIAVALTYLVCRRLGLDRIPSGVGAATLGGGKLFWANAVVAEVYCPALAVVALVIYLLLRSRQEARFGLTLLAAFVAGLGLGIHLSIATLGLGLAFLVWSYGTPVEQPSDLRRLFASADLGGRLRRSLAAGAMALLGSLVFLYLPIRAAQKPALNFGDPSNFERFQWMVTGGTYKGWFLDELDLRDRAVAIAEAFRDQLHVAGIVLSILGLVWLWRRRPLEWTAFMFMAAGNIGFFFRYRVHDIEVFFLPTTFLLCCFVGAGAQSLIDAIVRFVTTARAPAMRNLVRAALVVFAGALALGNYRDVDMSGFRETEKFIAAMETALPENAVILNFTTPPEWKRDAVFGMYAQKVLGKRPDVEIVIPLNPGLIQSALQSGRPVYAYVPHPRLIRDFEVTPDGPLFRVLGPRP